MKVWVEMIVCPGGVLSSAMQYEDIQPDQMSVISNRVANVMLSHGVTKEIAVQYVTEELALEAIREAVSSFH